MALITRRRPYPHFADYRQYKPRLREDFRYCCAYCSVHENEWGGLRHFHVEHFRPKSLFSQLITVYKNLLYACDVCNCYKGADWPSEDPLTVGVGYLDPCQHDYDEHFGDQPTPGLVEGLTSRARYMVERLHINRPHLVKLRQKRAQEEAIHRRFQQSCQEVLGMITCSLGDESLPSHVVRSLAAAQEVIDLLLQEHQRWWKERREPAYDSGDLRSH